MQDHDREKPATVSFQVPDATAQEFYRLAAAHFGMKKGSKRQMFLKMLDDQLRALKIAQLKQEIEKLERGS